MKKQNIVSKKKSAENVARIFTYIGGHVGCTKRKQNTVYIITQQHIRSQLLAQSTL